MLTEAQATKILTRNGGRVPCSRYGYDSESCAPVAYAAAVIVYGETGEYLGSFLDILDHCMSLVVNDHDDPGYLIANYGTEYGFDPADYLDDPTEFREEE
jgi:hypothetical protein